MTNAEFELFKILMKKTPEIPEKFKIMDFMGMKYLPTESEFGSLDADSLATQIKEVNEMEVAPEEILSDHAYLLTAYGVVNYK